jgi:Zn-dependent protease/CBS domain-containing protein
MSSLVFNISNSLRKPLILRLHISFVFLLAVLLIDPLLITPVEFLEKILAYLSNSIAPDANMIVSEIALVFAILLSLLLHEAGHLIINYFHRLPVTSLNVFPSGVVYSFSKETSNYNRCIVLLAGPIFSIMIGLILFLLQSLSTFSLPAFSSFEGLSQFIDFLVFANLFIGVLNLIPIYPFDGFLILKSISTIFFERHSVSIISRTLIVCSFIGVTLSMLWPSIWVFLLLAGLVILNMREMFKMKILESGVTYTLASLLTEPKYLLTLPHSMPASSAFSIIAKSEQSLIPVLHSQRYIGALERDNFLRHVASYSRDAYLSDFLSNSVKTIKPDHEVTSILEAMLDDREISFAVVDNDGSFIGLLIADTVIEYLVLNKFKKHTQNDELTGEDWL